MPRAPTARCARCTTLARLVRRRVLQALVEHHHDVAAEGELHIHGGFRGEHVQIAVQVRPEQDAFSVTLRSSLRLNTWKPPESVRMARGHDMNRCRPPKRADQFVPGPQKQVIGVGEQDADVEVVQQVALRQSLDGRLRADGHEDRGFDGAVRRVKDTGAGAGMRAGREDFEAQSRQGLN